jgi:hypothetical protein
MRTNNGELHSILLFFWTYSVVQYSKPRPLRFGSWLCSRLQVKISTLVGPIEGADPNPWSRAFVNTVMNFRVPQKAGHFLTSWAIVSFWRVELRTYLLIHFWFKSLRCYITSAAGKVSLGNLQSTTQNILTVSGMYGLMTPAWFTGKFLLQQMGGKKVCFLLLRLL